MTNFRLTLDNTGSTLGADYLAGSGVHTLAADAGARILAKLASRGKSVSATSPLVYTVVRKSAVNLYGQITDDSLLTVYEATELDGDNLSGVTVRAGYTDQNFTVGDVVGCLWTDGQVDELQVAITGQERGAGRIYDVTGYGAKGDGQVYTGSVSASSATLAISGYISSSADVGKSISVAGAGAAGVNLVTTIAGASSTPMTGSITATSTTLTVSGHTPQAGDVGKVIAIAGAAKEGGTLWTTVAGFSGQTFTLNDAATTAVSGATVTLAPTITLAASASTSVTSAAVVSGTDNWDAINTLVTTIIKPNATAGAPYATLYFPIGTFLIRNGAGNIPVSSIAVEGAGRNSVLRTIDSATTPPIGNVFVNYGVLHLRNMSFVAGTNSDPVNSPYNLVKTGGTTGQGQGCTIRAFNCESSGPWGTVFNLQNDDRLETYGCDWGCSCLVFHAGVNTAGVAQGSVLISGGRIHDFGVTGSAFNHGIYTRNSVSTRVDGVTFDNQFGTGACVRSGGGANGTALNWSVTRCTFLSTTINGILTGATLAVIRDNSFACSTTPIQYQYDALITGNVFLDCTDRAIRANSTGTAISKVTVTDNEFLNSTNNCVQLQSLAGSTLVFDRNYCSGRTAANAITVSAGNTSQVTNCLFSDSAGWGQATTSALPTAALAGAGASWWDTTLGVAKTSDGTTWHIAPWIDVANTWTAAQVFAPASTSAVPITVNAANGQTADLLDLKVNGTAKVTFDANGYSNNNQSISTSTTGINLRQSAPALQGDTTDIGTDLTLTTAWTAFQFTANFTDSIQTIQLRLKRSGTITNRTGGLKAQIWSDNAGQPGAILAGSGSQTLKYGQLGTVQTAFSIANGSQALTSGTPYWLVILENNTPVGASVVVDTGASNNTNVATSSNGSTWTVAAGASCWFQLLGRNGIGIAGQTTTSTAVSGISGVALAGNFTSTNGVAVNATSTGGQALVATSSWADAIQGTSTSGNGITLSTLEGVVMAGTQTGPLIANSTAAGISITRSLTLNGFTATGALVFVNDTSGSTGNLATLQKNSATVFSVNNNGMYQGTVDAIGVVGAAATIDVTKPNLHTLTSTASTNMTLTPSAAGTAGAHMWIQITSDATGGVVVTFASTFKSTGILTLTASKIHTICFISNGANWCEAFRSSAGA
jgi:hypothetical protein